MISIQENKHNPFQFVDNLHRDTSEQIVELYYQCKGYITSSNKWIPLGKAKGYTDIDVLAVNGKGVHIVSVSTNLDDKDIAGLNKFFVAVLSYLSRVEEYKWLSEKEIKKVLAVFSYPDKKQEKMAEEFRGHGIEMLYASQIFSYFKENLVPWRKIGLKTENPLVRTMQLVDYFMK
jgi:hypothetical protein